jgi:predicted transglutaminase-like cysteine proteinase
VLKQALQQVLDLAHSQHEYVLDIEQYGKNEHWTANLVGDCEDFGLWCREQLKQRGIAADLIYCKTETGGGHLVLHIDGWIIDNRHGWVMSKDDLPYTWISLGKPDGTWLAIESD